MSDPLHHRATYDDDGNIILPDEGEQTVFIREEDAVVQDTADGRTAFSIRESVTVLQGVANGALDEAVEEYRASVVGTGTLLRSTAKRAGSLLRRVWAFLQQPVRIPLRGGTNREYSRGILFCIDTVRFGGTFAGIFILLFVAINYQSFLQISAARIEEFFSPESIDGGDLRERELESRLERGAALLANAPAGSLISFLPEVGPPEDVLIIPKLHLTVPLVSPPVDSLLREDWKQLEKDIQASLERGVVHYPGTAEPGQAGNFFVTGHSSNYVWAPGGYNAVLARLHELQPGDEYWVYYGGDKHRYVIERKKEVRPTDISVLDQPRDMRMGTLMTCTPVGTTLRRLIVIAREVDTRTGEPLQVGERGTHEERKIQVEALPI